SSRCALALAVTSMLPPLRETTKASDNADFGAHSRSFRTCSPTLRVSCCHSRARLASGWLACLYREGVEPSGSLRKVSDHMFIPLSWTYPGATAMNSRRRISISPVSFTTAYRAGLGSGQAGNAHRRASYERGESRSGFL